MQQCIAGFRESTTLIALGSKQANAKSTDARNLHVQQIDPSRTNFRASLHQPNSQKNDD